LYLHFTIAGTQDANYGGKTDISFITVYYQNQHENNKWQFSISF